MGDAAAQVGEIAIPQIEAWMLARRNGDFDAIVVHPVADMGRLRHDDGGARGLRGRALVDEDERQNHIGAQPLAEHAAVVGDPTRERGARGRDAKGHGAAGQVEALQRQAVEAVLRAIERAGEFPVGGPGDQDGKREGVASVILQRSGPLAFYGFDGLCRQQRGERKDGYDQPRDPAVVHAFHCRSYDRGDALPSVRPSPLPDGRRAGAARQRSGGGGHHRSRHLPLRVRSRQSAQARGALHHARAPGILRRQRLPSRGVLRHHSGRRPAAEGRRDAAQAVGHGRAQSTGRRIQRPEARARRRLHGQHSRQAG